MSERNDDNYNCKRLSQTEEEALNASLDYLRNVSMPISYDFEVTTIDQIDLEIGKTLTEINKVENLIRQLSEHKARLKTRCESLKNEKTLQKSAHLESQNWDSETFSWSPNVSHALTKIFKMNSFRSQQLKTINAILAKNDVLLLAPTGGGKSLCFQLPAVINKGITIVISPLISLMEDQVWSLQKIGISVQLLCSTTEKETTAKIHRMLTDKSEISELKLLYVTPERMANSKRFMSALQKSFFSKKLNMFAIDEVHCCSQWGHDFRPDYKFIGSLKTMFPNIPILGVTATATTKVIVDVQKMLNMQECLVVRAPFNRPNLYYHVLQKPSNKEELVKLLSKLLKKRYTGMSGIIYTFSTKDADDLATDLVGKGILARSYHASLGSDRRAKVHSKWLSGEIQVVVATVAFGMGIDKPDVRFVIHHTISKSMENFYQESGRAGRDGKKAECILLYKFSDMPRITGMMFTERTGLANVYSMVKYCINGTSCRRDIIAKHFTEVWDESDCNRMCDRCMNKDRVCPPEMDISKYCRDLYKIIEHATNMDIKLTGTKLVDFWYQKCSSNLRVSHIKTPSLDRPYAEQIVAFLIVNGYLKEDFHFTPYNTISYIKHGEKSLDQDGKILFHGTRIYQLPQPDFLDSNSTTPTLCSTPIQTDKQSSKKRKATIEDMKNEPTTSSNGKEAKSLKKILKKDSIDRITSSVSRIVTELVEKETKRRLNLNSDSDESDSDAVILVDSDTDIVELD